MNKKNRFLGFIGTYTKRDSKGIYSFVLDCATEEIKRVTLAAEIENPTYLSINRNNRYLYSVAKENGHGGVAAFSLNHDNGELTEVNRMLNYGAPPCHLSLSRNGQLLLTANYHEGTASLFTVDEKNGSIKSSSFVAEHFGSGPDRRQEKAHTHFAAFTPDEQYVCVVELGCDILFTYEIQDGVLKEKNRLSVKAGSGPRHLAFHPNGKNAYIMTEFSSEVIVLAYHQENGSFTELQSFPTVSPSFLENNQGSAIHISSDGKFLYASNRGENTIAVFKIDDSSGKLQLVERTSTVGNWPRDFSLDPSEKFVIVANQESNNLTLFKRNKKTGKLSLLQSEVNVCSPVCIKFLNY